MFELVDDFGRVTKFEGVLLVEDTTDSEDARKPQWTETKVYRTTGGRYIVWNESKYRIRHLSGNCSKASGYDLRPATSADTVPCRRCNPDDLPGGQGQYSRTRVDVCNTPGDLIASLSTVNQATGLRTHSQYAQSLLADISEEDEAVRASWMEQVVL